jgi:hypothetical protein
MAKKNNTPPAGDPSKQTTRQKAIEAAEDQRSRTLDQIYKKEGELANAIGASKLKAEKELLKLLKEEENLRIRISRYMDQELGDIQSITDNLQKQANFLRNKGKFTKESNKATKLAYDLQKKGNKLTDKELQDIVQLNDEYKSINKEAETLTARLTEQAQIWEAAKKSANDFLGDVSKGIGKIPVIGESLSKGFDMFINSKYADKLKIKLAKMMFDPKVINKSFSAALGLGMVAAGTALIAAGVKVRLAREQDLKDQQRSIGLTKEQTVEVDKMQRGLLNSSDNMVVSLEEARKAYSELVDDFGTTGAQNKDLVDQQVKLTKAYGLQAEEATNLQKAAMINGQSAEEMKIDILSTAEGFNKAKGSSYSLSGVMKTVSKLSDSVRLQFRGSNTELTAAVMKAKALGTSLEDLNGIADNLLNIESSIEAQVTAQIVTGKNINMEKARMFALMDDMPGLMDELVKQEIDYNSYSKMNRIEKQSTAAALGMNIDQMAKFVSQQELSKQLGIDMSDTQNQTALGLENSLKSRQEEIAQLAKAGNMAALQYEKDNEALTTQEKLTAAVERMAKMFEVMSSFIIGIGAGLVVVGAIMAALAIKTALAAAAALTWSSALTFGVGAAVAVGAAIAAYNLIPGMATGGEVVGGNGPVVVGENGPEIVRLKKGNMVTPNDQLTNLASNNKPAPSPIVNVSLVVGNTAINEIGNKISMNQSYNQGVGNTYNRLG